MKSLYKTLFFVLFLFSTTLQAQSIPDKYEGIPLEAGLDWWCARDYPNEVDKMKKSGVDIVHISFIEADQVNTFFTRYDSLHIIPVTTPKHGGGVYNWIQYYTDAKYSVWEAEGTSPLKGKATLYRNESKTDIDPTQQFITLNPDSSGDTCTMIWGPYYLQDVEYETYEDGSSYNVPVAYTADFRLKLECVGIDNASPTDTLCILQVTQSTISVEGYWHIECTDTVFEKAITRGAFTQLNHFDPHISNPYTLENFSCKIDTIEPEPRWLRERIEYKVIWTGNANYTLSIDKVIISDPRGALLKNSTSDALINLERQATSLTTYQDSVFGWLGIDEPQSIDQFEPIRVVDSLLRAKSSNQRPIVIPIMGCLYNGTFSHPDDLGAMGLNKYEEMKLRIGDFNIIQNAYMFDTPCNASTATLDKCDNGDIRAINISIAANDIYKHAYTSFPNFGASLQCGAVFNLEASQRNVARHEVLYSANLALMYGAKYLQLYRYFPETHIDDSCSGKTYHGIIDWKEVGTNFIPIYTDKYSMLRDTLSPRMKGLMGKTLRQLIPIADSLGKNASTNYNLTFNRIERVRLANYYGTEALNSFIDIGTFKKESESTDDYFMVINRWYSDAPHNKFYIQFRNLCDFRNWNLMNYVDTTSVTLVSDINGVVPPSPVDTIVVGDAILYSLKPVAEFGGKLLVSENVGDGMTLTGDMTIENGATLFIYDTYNSKANITVKSGGKIMYGENAKIIFDPGKKLIIEGSAEIKGSSFINKLTLEFSNSATGIDVLPGSSLTLSYCNITGAYNGLVTRTGTPSYLNITYSNFAFGSTGIVLNGNYYIGGPTPTSTISNCNFTTWGTGISVTNNNSVIISQNSFASCGISILNVAAAYIQGNNISSGSNESYSGIFFNNSGGYIRSNIIKNRVNGIHLANSSPDIGGNIIKDNYKHSMYVGSGSFPNMVGHIQINPPLYFPLSGYNTIRNNGNNTQSGTENDGSEIYLSGTNIALRDGCNEISDDRQSAPNMNTLFLMNGSLASGGGRQLVARNNYWGTTTPTNSRFGLLSVLFTPYFGGPCLLPDGSGGSEEVLVFKTSTGEVVDTIYAAEGVPENFTTLEASYSEADNYFATGNVELAKPLYEQIVSG